MSPDPEAASGAAGFGRAADPARAGLPGDVGLPRTADPARDHTLPVERWLAAAGARVSRRNYTDEPVSGPAADALDGLCRSFAPFEGARTVLLRHAPPQIFTGWLLHVYGKVSSPSALVFVGDQRVLGAAARAGYTGEAAVLEATALGFATCWIGGGVHRGAVEEFLKLEPYEHVYSISALGYTSGEPSLGERATAGLVKARKRKSLESIAPGIRTWPTQVRVGVEAARLAPSATNRQPWRFTFAPASQDPGSSNGPVGPGAKVRLSFERADTPVISKRLDCGIAMLHFELGVRAAGVAGSWALLEGNDMAAWTFAPERGASS
ncbi:MAG: nitroreductase family protein [Thermoleophilia bacterium]